MRVHDKRYLPPISIFSLRRLDILKSINLKGLKDQARVPERSATRVASLLSEK